MSELHRSILELGISLFVFSIFFMCFSLPSFLFFPFSFFQYFFFYLSCIYLSISPSTYIHIYISTCLVIFLSISPQLLSITDVPAYNYEFVKRAVNMSLDKQDKERELVSKMISASYPDIFSTSVISKGFERLFEIADEIGFLSSILTINYLYLLICFIRLFYLARSFISLPLLSLLYFFFLFYIFYYKNWKYCPS